MGKCACRMNVNINKICRKIHSVFKWYICITCNWEKLPKIILSIWEANNIKCDSTHRNLYFFSPVSDGRQINVNDMIILWRTYRQETAWEERFERLWVEVCRSVSLWNHWIREHDSTISHMLKVLLQPHLQTKLW